MCVKIELLKVNSHVWLFFVTALITLSWHRAVTKKYYWVSGKHQTEHPISQDEALQKKSLTQVTRGNKSKAVTNHTLQSQAKKQLSLTSLCSESPVEPWSPGTGGGRKAQSTLTLGSGATSQVLFDFCVMSVASDFSM